MMEIIIYGIICLCILLILTMRLHAQKLKIKHYKFTNSKIKANCKICFVSDFHYKHFLSPRYYKRMIQKINALDADVVIFGGDYVNRSKMPNEADAETFIELLSTVNIPTKIAVLGNHDKDNFDDVYWMQLFAKHQIVLLMNQQLELHDLGIYVTGVDDFRKGNAAMNHELFINDFQLLLTHNPDFIETIDPTQFDLILSGHLHGGQGTLGFDTYPALRIFKLSVHGKKYRYGSVGNKLYDHISTSGIGAHFGLRLGVYPEIVCIDLEKK